MSININLNDTTPAAPAGKLNVKFQAPAPPADPNAVRNVSAYVEPCTATTPGLVPTPPNDATQVLLGNGTFGPVPGGGGGSGADSGVELLHWARADVYAGSINIYDDHGSSSSRWGSQNITASKIDATATERVKCRATSPASAVAAVYGNNSSNGLQFTLGVMKNLRVRMKLVQTTNCRIWIGLSDGNLGSGTSPVKADIPNLNLVGFRYSTAAGDTKWMCVTQTDNTHQTATAESTASHVDTNFHIWQFFWDGANVIFKIDGTQVGSQSTNAPATSLKMDFFVEIDEVGSGVAKSFDFDWVVISE